MAKSYFKPSYMYEHLAPHVGSVDDFTVEELAEELSEVFWAEFPSADGFPTIFPGQPDFKKIAQILKTYDEQAAIDAMNSLGNQWLDLMLEHEQADEPGHANGLDKQLLEIEEQLPALYLDGLSQALTWVLRRQLQEAIDDHDHHDLA